MNTFTIQVPSGSNSTFLKNLARNMGWEMTVKRVKDDESELSKKEFYAKVDEAKKQVVDGKTGPTFDNADDLISYLESRRNIL